MEIQNSRDPLEKPQEMADYMFYPQPPFSVCGFIQSDYRKS